MLLALALGLLAGLPAQAHADTVGAFDIVATEPGQTLDSGDYSYGGNVLEITSGKAVTVSMKDGVLETTTDRIVVSSAAADVTLAGVAIDVSSSGGSCAFEIESGASASITLAKGSDNSLASGNSRAGLEVPEGASVSIGGEGSLEAKCESLRDSTSGAGIGGGAGDSAGSIEITGGTVTALCKSVPFDALGAGIGGGYVGSGGDIKISGGTVTASCESVNGSANVAGIGGYAGTSIGIAISGGRIKALGSTGIDRVAKITGGMFSDGDLGANTVYGVTPASGFAVHDSGDAGYPYAVAGAAGDFKVDGGTRGVDYSYDYPTSTLKVLTGIPVTISMRDGVAQTERDRIAVTGAAADVTLAGVKIDVSGDLDEYGDPRLSACAFAIGSGSSASVTLAEGSDSLLVSGGYRAGLEVGNGASVTIGGEGALDAKCFGERAALGAGIGGGDGGSGGIVKITDGTVTASCESVDNYGGAFGAGIGGGYNGSGGSVEITGGTVTASCEAGGGAYGTGIGGGYCGSDGAVKVSGGTVTALCEGIGVSYGAGIGGGMAGSNGSLSISGGRIKASGYGSGIGGGGDYRGDPVDVSITGGLFADGALGAGTSAGTVYKVEPSAGCVVRDNPFEDKGDYPYAVAAPAGDFMVTGGAQGVDYSYANSVLELRTGTPMVVSMKDGITQTKRDCIAVPAGTNADVTLAGVKIDMSGNDRACAFEIKSGATADVTLAEGSSNLLVSDMNRAGLEVPDGASVVIGGKGSLEAKCFSKDNALGAGIGGRNGRSGGIVKITDGTVAASCEGAGDNGSAYGAGIGGGYQGSGGGVEVNGGKVTALCKGTGASFGAGIGGGLNGSASSVKILGGEVVASCESVDLSYGAGIGGGWNGSGGSVEISNGTVTALCKSTGEGKIAFGTGIGGGLNGSAGSVRISGGTVTASCESDGESAGAGIGGGSDGSAGSVKISGGTVTASCESVGRSTGAGIGSGFGGSGGSVGVTGGSVSASCKAPDGKALGVGIGDGDASTTPVNVSITGGVFASSDADVDIAADKVCGASVGTLSAPLAVIANSDPVTSVAYPVTVCEKKVYTPVLTSKGGFVYDGNSLSAADFDLSAASPVPMQGELADAAAFESKEASAFGYGPEMPKNAGSYDVRATLAKIVREEDGAPVCYVANGPADVQATIAPKPISVSSSSVASRTYDGTTDAKVESVTFENLVDGESLTMGADFTATGMFEDAFADADKKVDIKVLLSTSGAAANYALVPGDVTGAASIAKAKLTVTAKDFMIVYGDEPKNEGASYSGFVNNEDSNVLEGDLVFSFGSYKAGSAIGSYPIIPVGLKSANYDIEFKEGNLQVVSRVLSAAVASGTTKTYDGTPDFSGVELVLGNVHPGDDVSATADGTVDDASAASDKPFTATAIRLKGSSVGNYELSGDAVTGAASIAKAKLTVAANNAGVAYGDEPKNEGVSYSGFVNNEDSNILEGDLVLSFGDYKAGSAVGNYPIDPAGLTAANYNIDFVKGELRVAPRVLTAEVAPGMTKTYNGSADFSGVELKLGNVHPGDVVSATADGTVDDVSAGTGKSFTATAVALAGAAAGNYSLDPATVAGAVSIDPRPISLSSATVASKQYDGNTDAEVKAVEFGNLVTGEVLALGTDYSVTGAFDSAAASGDRVAHVAVALEQTPIAANYELTAGSIDVASSIDPRPISVSSATVASKTYDGKPDAKVEEVSFVDLVPGESLAMGADYSATGIFADSLAGTGKAVCVTAALMQTDVARNYELSSDSVDVEADVAKALLTVTANNAAVAYGDDPKDKGVSYAGFVNNEGSDVLGGTLSFSFGDYAPGSAAGNYPILPAGLESNNYAITFKKGELKVAARVLSAEVAPDTMKTYDGTPDFAGVKLKLGNVFADDVVSATADGHVDNPAAGDAKDFATTAVHLAGADASNYELDPSKVTGSVSITKAPLTVIANNAAVAYGDGPKDEGVFYGGFVPGEDSSVLKGDLIFSFGGYKAGSAVGTYPIAPAGLTAANYDIEFKPGKLEVAARVLSAEVAPDASKTYDGSADFSGVELVLGNVHPDDDVSATADGHVDNPAAGDAKQFAATTVHLEGSSAVNYVLSVDDVAGAASITKAPLLVTANNAEVAYGDDPENEGVSYTGFVNNEGSDVLGGALKFSFGDYKAGSAVGNYPILPAGLSSDNYAIDFKQGELKVAARILTAEIAPGTSRAYDGTPDFTGAPLVLGNVFADDDVSATADGNVDTPSVTDSKDFAATAVHLVGSSATNYALDPSAVTGTASISPRQISVSSASVASKTYDGTTDAKVEEVLFDNLVEGESLTMGQDFTATGAFESSAAGKGKKALVEVSLVPESPVCKNYSLAEGGSSVEATGDIVQSGTSLDLSVGGAIGGQGLSFFYGETMSFTVTPQAAPAPAFRSAAEPTLQLFVVGADGSETPLCEPVKGVAEGKQATVYYDTRKKLLPVGTSTVRARVSGLANLQDAYEDVQVTVKPKGATLSWSGLDDRVYGDGAQASAQLVGALPGDDVRVEVSGGAETEAGGPYAATASLAGEDASFYAIEGSAAADYSIAKAPAFAVNAPVDMKRLQPGDEASVNVAALLPEAARDASFEVVSFTREGLVSAEVDAAGILTLTSDAPASAQRDEVEVRLSNMANCEDSKVVVNVSYVDKPVAQISGVTAAGGLVYDGSPQAGFAGKPVASFGGETYEGDFKLSYEGVGGTAYGPSDDAPTRAGDYVATFSVPGDEPSCAGSASLGFSIGRAPLAVTAKDVTATYGEEATDAGAAFEGFVPGEGSGNLTGSLKLAIEGYEADSPAGSYPIVPSGLSSEDYIISFVPGRLEVLPRALSAKIDAGDSSASRPYDGTAAFFGVSLLLEGVLPGDEVLAAANGSASGALVADDLGFEALSVRLEGADAASYALSPTDVEGRVSISRASLTVRAADASMVAGERLPELGFDLLGLAASDEVLAPPALSVEGDASVPGSCSIVPSGISVTNQDCYDVAYENGTLTVLVPDGGGQQPGGDGPGDGEGEVSGPGGDSDAGLAPTGDPLAAAPPAAGALALLAAAALAASVRRRARR